MMARIVNLRSAQTLTGQAREWAYNAIDCIATHEIGTKLLDRMEPEEQRTYGFERAVQPIAAQMTVRGIKVDVAEMAKVKARLTKEEKAESAKLAADPLITSIWDITEKDTGACPNPTRKDGKHKWDKAENERDRVCQDCGAKRFKPSPFNPNSPDQLKHLFYDLLRMKAQRGKTGEVTTDDDAMGRLKGMYPKHADLIDRILKIKGLRKNLSFLKSKLSEDNRFHASFSVGTTWTGRWASSADPFNRGNNAQNITEALRGIFVADDGYELCYADLKQAESNIVAHLTGDEAYIEAHKGDTHTFVCRMVWPDELPWGDDPAEWKKVATSHYPEWDNKAGHDYRYQSKAVQHGSNLGLTPFGLAIQRKISVRAATEAQARYFEAFPGIPEWQKWVQAKVEAQERLVNPLGVRARLFGRPWSDHTFKQGYAYLPQSAVAHIINIAIWRLWQALDPDEIILLAQIHDAILFQYPIEKRDEVLAKVSKLMRIPVEVTDIHGVTRTTLIETEAAIGHRWAHHSETYPDGLVAVKGF